MVAKTFIYGHRVWFNEKIKKRCLVENDKPAFDENCVLILVCQHCDKPPTVEGHDGCLGTLKDCSFACCGHGGKSNPYITTGNGEVFRGEEALKKIEERK